MLRAGIHRERLRRTGCLRAALHVAPWLVAALCASPSPAATITRGPYLQRGSPTGLVVRWRTDVATDSRVELGAAPDSLSPRTDSLAATVEHVVELAGLSPDTRYYYAVGSTGARLAGGDSTFVFVTAPADTAPRATRIWLLGDSGTAGPVAAQVRDRYFASAGTRHTDAWIMLGDNAYPAGSDSSYQVAVFDFYPDMLRRSVLWAIPGNHDCYSAVSSAQTGPYFDNLTLPANGEAGGLASGTEAYYSFNLGNIHVVALDSAGDLPRTPGSAMLAWLESNLAADRHQWCIAMFHHPPYTHGQHSSDDSLDSEARMFDMRRNVLPILEAHGVDLVFSGHSHTYERSMLVDGHYSVSATLDSTTMILDAGSGQAPAPYHKAAPGRAPHQGTVYIVAGSSGETSPGVIPLDHPVMYRSLDLGGSVFLDVTGDSLAAAFLDNGGNIQDRFSMTKAPFDTTSGGAGITPFEICRNDPNPFTSLTTVRFTSDRAQHVVLEIFDVTGRRVVTAYRGLAPAGEEIEVTVDGSSWPSGLYFAQLRGDAGEVRRPMVHMR